MLTSIGRGVTPNGKEEEFEVIAVGATVVDDVDDDDDDGGGNDVDGVDDDDTKLVGASILLFSTFR